LNSSSSLFTFFSLTGEIPIDFSLAHSQLINPRSLQFLFISFLLNVSLHLSVFTQLTSPWLNTCYSQFLSLFILLLSLFWCFLSCVLALVCLIKTSILDSLFSVFLQFLSFFSFAMWQQ
jgi:hypothetical protein